MQKIRRLPLLLSAVLLSGWLGISAQISRNISPCAACETLIKLDIPDVRITEAVVNADKKFCNVKGIIGSEIAFELKLPKQ